MLRCHIPLIPSLRSLPGRTHAPIGRRYLSSPTPPRKAKVLSRRTLVTSGALTALAIGGATIYADASDATDSKPAEPNPAPLSALVRSYVVYSMCSIPALVDWAPSILSTLMAVPGVSVLTEAFIRATFFEQFVGADTAQGTVPLLEQLRAENKGALFAYSVEVNEKEAAGSSSATSTSTLQPAHKRFVQEMIHSIDVAADFEDRYAHGRVEGRRTWVAVKLTALLPHAQSLINLSLHLTRTRPAPASPVAFPGTPQSSDLAILHQPSPTRDTPSILTSDDIAALKDLNDDLVKICTRAQERGVKIIIDAEHSWYQPAIDAFGHALMERFNKLPSKHTTPRLLAWFSPSPPAPGSGNVQPLVYVTYQAYLRRTPAHLALSFAAAKAGNYALGVKLVRGAYHPHETSAHALAATSSSLSISPDPHPPVWPTKPETDACYNACAALLLSAIESDVPAIKSNPSTTTTHDTPSLGVLFGTHNRDSCDLILDGLVQRRLAVRSSTDGTLRIPEEVAERVAFGQLYGMSDSLTNYIAGKTRSSSPCVIKYVPYGALVEVMPYLSRRAIENKSVLGNGGAARERKEAGAEMWRRVFG
ncbi:FAD-linked oxidoreductase [Leucogyrophana mollusca]|uniref:FAD-linked oxidoreductase n=1 Tax=Leucogyrophana mollusca TaxID=85980 RepID=A0ACB8B9X5_9AGAM|nr:FAD-linked oxidoreductase [Leucogyrophana mollusca]